MKNRWLLLLLCIAGLGFILSGCNSSSTRKNTASKTADYPNSYLLASAADLNDSGVVLIDARSVDAYNAGHIPGAVNITWQQFVGDGMVLKPIDELETELGGIGLTRETRMIIYDNTINSWGASGRLFWMFEYLGCDHVRILNGGWDKWIADGHTPDTIAHFLPAATFTAIVQPSRIVDKERIASRLNDDDFVVVDTRTDEEYMGWQLYGEARGGHIKGAVQIPYAWYFNADDTILSKDKLQTLLDSHGVTRDKEVTAYCTAGIRSGFFYFLTRLMGYDRTANYDGSILDWAAADPTQYPMTKAPRFSTIVYPAWVKALIDYHAPGSTSAAPPEYPYGRDHKYLIFETQWGTLDDATAYKSGHIPGAIHSNSDTYENGYPRWFLIGDDALHTAMGSMGITPDTTVIVYSDSPIFAARLWWILKYGGVTDVRFLNGGYAQWVKDGYAGETRINYPVPTTFTGSVQPQYLATTDYVFDHYTDTATELIADVRSHEEYVGLTSGYSYVLLKGRIPNAVWAHDADDSAFAYDDPDYTLRSFDEISALWNSVGMTTSTVSPNLFDKEVIFHCGSGYRSALAFLCAYAMGYDNIRNYSDGWEGWSTTYVEDPSYTEGITPGWHQYPSGRPVIVESQQ